MGALYDRVNVLTATTGTGTVTLGAATGGGRTFADASVPNGTIVSYLILDGSAWEVGTGTYNSATPSLTRTLISSSTGSLLNLTGAATVAIAANTRDFPGGKQTIWVPASAMIPRATNGPGNGAIETTTNRVNVSTLDFDATTQEFAQFQIAMPKSWDEGTVTFGTIWYHPVTSTNFGVVWSLAGTALSDTNALETAFGTAVTVADTGGTTNTVYDSPESAAVTIGNTPAENDFVVFQVARVPANASDTMAVDARLLGIRLYYNVNAGNDT
jgi:hypothetical protein